MSDAPDEAIEAMARAIREEIVRQYRDNERHKGPLSSHDYEEMVAPTQILRAALRAASAAGWRMERDWQSIDTAPKDGSSVLWGHPVHGVQQGHWANGPVSCVYDEDIGHLAPFPDWPTHWRPLAAAPKLEEQG